MSLNDPQWGRRGGSGNSGNSGGNEPPGQKPGGGPPDLDELWRNFNDRLAGLFGRRGGGGSGGGTPPSMRQLGSGVFMILFLAIAVWVASGFFVVDERQEAVVLQFGKFNRTAGPGLNWRFPYPFQSHELVDVKIVRTTEVGYQGDAAARRRVPREALMLTEDENIVDVQFAVQYSVQNARDYLFNNFRAEESVKQAAETAMREIVGKSKIDYVLKDGRDKIRLDAHKLMQEILDRYKTGIVVTQVNLQETRPPEQVQAAFDDVVKAGQDRERAENEGKAYANDVIPKAKGAAARLLEEANAYRQSVVANAEGEASRFSAVLREYEKAPQVTRERLYLDTIQQVMSSTTKVLVDARQGNNMLFLPLDRIIQMTGQSGDANQPAAAPRPQVVEPPAPAPAEPPSRRDMLRGRDREAR